MRKPAMGNGRSQVAERLARLIRKAPPEQLDRLMASPAGPVILAVIFNQMPRRLDRKKAAGTTASVRWQIRCGPDRPARVYRLEIDDGSCRVIRGPDGPEPQVTITLDAGQLLRIATGAEDPTQAYFNGRIALAGDVMVAAKLGSLFVVPGR